MTNPRDILLFRAAALFIVAAGLSSDSTCAATPQKIKDKNRTAETAFATTARSAKFAAKSSDANYTEVALPTCLGGKFAIVPAGSDRLKVFVHRTPVNPRETTARVPIGGGLFLTTNYDVVDNPAILSNCNCDQLIGVSYDTMPVSDGALKPLRNWKKLEYIDLRNSDVTDAGFSALSDATTVVSLNCAMGNLNGSGLKYLNKWNNLQYLNLAKNPLQEPNLAGLVPLKRLRELEIRRAGLTNQSIDYIEKLGDLRWLSIGENRITAKAIARLKCLKNLETLKVPQTLLTINDVRIFKEFKSLKRLDIGGLGFTDKVGRDWGKELPGVAVCVAAAGPAPFPIEVFRPLH